VQRLLNFAATEGGGLIVVDLISSPSSLSYFWWLNCSDAKGGVKKRGGEKIDD
jgi:hypothetical protein